VFKLQTGNFIQNLLQPRSCRAPPFYPGGIFCIVSQAIPSWYFIKFEFFLPFWFFEIWLLGRLPGVNARQNKCKHQENAPRRPHTPDRRIRRDDCDDPPIFRKNVCDNPSTKKSVFWGENGQDPEPNKDLEMRIKSLVEPPKTQYSAIPNFFVERGSCGRCAPNFWWGPGVVIA